MAIGGIIASGVGSAIGSAGGGIISSVIQSEYNKAEAQKNRDWQEYMSNTAMQRAVKDYKAAGISPAMMFAGGGGNSASTPSGSSAQISKPDFGIASVMNAVANIINTDRKIDYLEQVQNNNTAMSMQRNYNRQEMNSYFDNIDNVKI